MKLQSLLISSTSCRSNFCSGSGVKLRRCWWTPPAVDIDDDDANTDADFVSDTRMNAVATGNWTLDEDAKLTSAVTNTSKKQWGADYKTNWVAIAALIPGRTRSQCRSRWREFLDPNIGRANERTGTWTEDEDSKLKDAVRRTVARTGLQLPHWFQVERNNSF
jgi:hypothetical protein